MAYDVARIRSHFPSLAEGAAHFDGPGGSQVPDVVGEAVARTLTSAISNRGTVTASERRAEQVVTECRAAVADLLGADPRGVVFGRSATALTYDVGRALAAQWGPGDEVVVTRLDHDANIRPWVQLAAAAGASVRWVDFDPETGELPTAAVEEALTPRTRLVATTAAANLIGTRPDTAAISRAAHAVGAVHWVDGVHATAHVPVDVEAVGADVWTCSPYKFLGPHCGVLAADPGWLETLHPDKLLPSPEVVPERFELGTLPYELMAGTTAAVDLLARLDDLDAPVTPENRRARLRASVAALEEHEERLLGVLEPALRDRPGVRVFSNAARRTPTLLFTLAGHDPQEVRRALAARGVNAPAGSFYAVECSRHLGLGDAGGVRVGLAPYTDAEDVDRLLTALDATG
ncbi:cysteine desulfurase-like protein [Phycicoccus endophyticus]|uniref:Cysteine desulfurase-like protein n=1 Tax=Phycicoccus endophyticus TaxID=1690220 RepID=A0A7G9R1R0_9MICO|nr:cysteine desulfurase-like protein [Phycicoccus endophyticus]NHI18673.1 cysteine desulfurase-like protein [Phycicoccus endophyticus]QNN49535.1 cysteine desulfurase-like protein [Phycicoccus endophyticus]GGL37367.1 cysteine desulfurase-like protein [Phycicoccus endophyticus]